MLIDVIADIVWKLLENLLFVFVVERLVFVVVPFEFEMSFNAHLQILVDGRIIVEFTNQAEEPGQLISLVNRVIKFSETVDDFKEDAHKVGKNGYTKE